MKQSLLILTSAAVICGPCLVKADPLPAAYRGALICEKVKNGADILHAPLDLMVQDGKVVFARPLFNLDGTRVVGSEIGEGTVD